MPKMVEALRPENNVLPIKDSEPNTGRLIVITGPSNCGKDAVTRELLQDQGLQAKRLVTCTTRPPRPDEVDGVDYHFITRQQFAEMDANGLLAEKVDYRGQGDLKGTPRAPFNEVIKGGTYIWRIDPSRAAKLDAFFTEQFSEEIGELLRKRTTVVYLGVSQLVTIYHRAINRAKKEKEKKGEEFKLEDFKPSFKNTLKNDLEEWDKSRNKFQHLVRNDGTLEDTVNEIKGIIFQQPEKDDSSLVQFPEATAIG